MASIEAARTDERWEEDGCFLTQEFQLHGAAGAPDALEVVRQTDAMVKLRTRAAGLGLTRWDGDSLMLGWTCVLRLGPLEMQSLAGFSAAAGRAILGGWIARRPGGSIWYRVRPHGDGLVLIAGLSGFFPRLPKLAFRTIQAPLHRATIRRAVGDLAAVLDTSRVASSAAKL
jgi:hypothetical protein